MSYFSYKKLIENVDEQNPFSVNSKEWRGYETALEKLYDSLEKDQNAEMEQQFLHDVYGLERLVVNEYHIKLRHEDYNGWFDWYHTTGTIIANRNGGASNIGKSKDAETVAKIIIKHTLQ